MYRLIDGKCFKYFYDKLGNYMYMYDEIEIIY